MKYLTYCFLWLFAVTNTIAGMIYIGYYFLFISQFNAALPGWFLVLISLIEIPLIIRVASKQGTLHTKLVKLIILADLFLILITTKISLMTHNYARPVTVTEILTIFLLSTHLIGQIIVSRILKHPKRSKERYLFDSVTYLICVTLSLVTIAVIGEQIFLRVQTEVKANTMKQLLSRKQKSKDTHEWIVYEHRRLPEEALPGFRMSVPKDWHLDDASYTVSTSSAQIIIKRKNINSTLCLFPDTTRTDALYNNNIYVSLLPVMSLTITGETNVIGLKTLDRHADNLTLLVCEKWIRFDGTTEYSTEVSNQNMGTITILLNSPKPDTLRTIKKILESIAILP